VVRELTLPVIRNNRIVAIIGMGNKPADYTENDVQVVSELTNIAWDIISRKRAEERISYFSRIFEDSLNEIYIFDADTLHFIQVNRSALLNLGYSMDELGNMTPLHIKPAITIEMFSEIIEPLRRGREKKVVFETEHQRKDGSRYPVEVHLQLNDSESRKFFTAIILDITERKMISDFQSFLVRYDYLRAGEDFFRALARYMGETLKADFVCIDKLEDENLSARTLAVWFDGKFEDNLTYTLKDTPCGDVVDKTICSFSEGVRHLFPKDEVLQQMKAEGYMGTTLRDSQRQSIGLIALIWREPLKSLQLAEAILKMASVRAAGELERRLAEETLRINEQRYRKAQEMGHVGNWEYNLKTALFWGSDEAKRIYGFDPEQTDFSVDEVENCIPEREMTHQALVDLIENGKEYNLEFEIRPKNSTEPRFVASIAEVKRDENANPLSVVGVIHDITERKRLEEEHRLLEAQLRQAQKMEAVGQLAGGVAHDFNNLLYVITGYADMMLDDLPPDGHLHNNMKEIMEAAQRATTLVRQLLLFSRREAMQMKVLNLNVLISELIKMLRRVIGEHITLEFLPGFELMSNYGDPGQLEQVLMNLCVNARDAMPSGGRIVIETENISLDAEYCRYHSWAKEGDYVLLKVSDTGCGIPAEIQDHIFEPFFTTKDVGKGTGLGLAAVYGIVRSHQGTIRVYSEPGQGAVFKIYLPAEQNSLAPLNGEKESAVPVSGGRETILVAEDEESVRNMIVHILKKVGYQVLSAKDGEEAIGLFEKHSAEIDLALLDVIMPKMGGQQVYERLRVIRPDIPIIFSTGYSRGILNSHTFPDERYNVIQKPVSPTALLRKIREVLDM
jgi:PAS domain S-box-containing protein